MVSALAQTDRSDPSVRVRFAPSPTGALHIGGARTALFNWLFARHTGGKLVLRIEDTDRERSTPENVEQILDALRWLQLDWDEGPTLQSERSGRHREALQALLDSGRAYRSSATADDVKAYKQLHGAEHGFRGEAQAEGAVRLRVPDEGETVVHDAIRGDTSFAHVHLDDPVIARADGSVLYNFAVAIDDLDARITHVVRDAGYLPAAVRNYLALLGWGAGDDQTVLSTDELVERFTLQRVSRNPARFDETKLKWLDGVHIRALGVDELAGLEGDFLDEVAGHPGVRGDERFAGAVAISQEKIHTLADFWPLAGFIFAGPATDPTAREKWLGQDGLAVLAEVRAALDPLADFDQVGVQTALEGVLERLGGKPRAVYQPVRVAISGTTISPGIFESVALLGREETLRRIDA